MTNRYYSAEIREELDYLYEKLKRYQTLVDSAQRHSNIDMLIKYINKRDAVYRMYMGIIAGCEE